MKLQRQNKYNGKIVKSIAAVLLTSTILAGCSGIEAYEKLDEIKDALTQIETIEPTVSIEPTPIQTLEPVVEPTPVATLEPTIEPTMEPIPEIPSFAKETIEFDDQIALYNIATLVFETDSGDIKIIPVLYEIVPNEYYSNYYDLYTGKLLFSADLGFYPMESKPAYIYEIFYTNSNLEKWNFIDAMDITKYYNIGAEYFTNDEYLHFKKVISKYFVDGVSTEYAFHTIEEYHQLYEDAIPERYRVDSYELFGENDKVMVKGN